MNSLIELISKFQSSLMRETGRTAYELTVPESIYERILFEISRYRILGKDQPPEAAMDKMMLTFQTGDIKIINGDRVL